MQTGTILPLEEINKLFSDLLKEAGDVDSVQKYVITHPYYYVILLYLIYSPIELVLHIQI
jgi:hypothetical protein